MRVRVLVEGPSEEAFFSGWLRRYMPGHYFQVIPHQGKGKMPSPPTRSVDARRQGLLDQLPAKLRAYGRSLNPDTDRVLVVVDADEDNCVELKNRLLKALQSCDRRPEVLFRIAVEETEAFYLGDFTAIKKAYPGANRMQYDQDSICGTWEIFQKTIGARSESKVFWGRQMGQFLAVDPRRNRSPSFKQLCSAIKRLCGEH